MPRLLAAACAAALGTGAVTDKPPHVFFMLVDDLGWNDMGWHDQFDQVKTPKLNALVADSIQLSQYYVYRFCSPSRSTFLSGRYPWHLGQHTRMNLNPTPGIACGINKAYDFLPKVLKQKGYATWALGKWHVGYLSNGYTPTYRGFDHYLGYYSGAEEHFTHTKNGEGYTAYDLANNTGATVAPCLGPVGNGSSTYSSYLYGNETLRLLAAHDPAVPLYVYLAWNNVHAPCEAPDNYLAPHANISNGGRRGLLGMVSAIDDQLTAVVDALKGKGMWDDTILIFSTDNGGNLGGSGINYPLRGGKYTFWQGGVRGVGFVGGGRVPASRRGTTWDGAVHAADWYATIAGVAGASVESTGPLPADGVDVWPALAAGAASPREEVVLQVISTSAANEYDRPSDDYCDANPAEAPFCDEAPGARPQLASTPAPLPARPYPYPTPCDGGAAVWEMNGTFNESVCIRGGAQCFNVQKSKDRMILWDPKGRVEGNAQFRIDAGGALRGVLRGGCVSVAGEGAQLMYADACDDGWRWAYDAATGRLSVTAANGTELCIAAAAGPPTPAPPPPAPAALSMGALIRGKWKLIYGYPGWKDAWDGWIQPPTAATGWEAAEEAPRAAGGAGAKFCEGAPCLFDIVADPTEHDDVSAQHPDVVANLTARLRELVAGEVTVAASGLCPTEYGSKADPRCKAIAQRTGFWEPWLSDDDLAAL